MSLAPPVRLDDWWKTSVVYQIYPRSFADSDGDGIGDLPGIISKVDYLHQLGVDVIWLSPIFKSPMDDNGYDISDYQSVDPLFGTLADLDRLIFELHSRGMKLVLDMVVNHTSDEHPWFVESRDPASRMRDWYWWRPSRDDDELGMGVGAPTNWGSMFSGSAWEQDPKSGEYYLHLFSRKQPDLNWENPEVRHAIYSMMKWWVGRGIDGFRLDVINAISKPTILSDGDLPAGGQYSPSLDAVANGHRLNEFLKEMNAVVGLRDKNLLSVGEMPGSTIETARTVTDPESRELDMVFTFEHMFLDAGPAGGRFDLQPLPLAILKKNLADWQTGLADRGWNSLYWDNHDQPRAVSRFGDDSREHRVASAKTLATVQHMHRGTPYIYQGEELGMTNPSFQNIDQYRDIETLNYYAESTAAGMTSETAMARIAAKSRDNARTPMQWNTSAHAGFTSGEPWLPENPNYVSVNAEASLADPDSVFHHFRKLIALRRNHDVLVNGRFELLLPEHEQIWAIARRLDQQLLVMIANFSSESAVVPVDRLPSLSGGRVLLSTHDGPETSALRPWESVVYLLATEKAGPNRAH